MQNQTPITSVPASQDDEIDLQGLVHTLLLGKWILLACALLGLLGGAFFAFISPRIYQADALIQVETDNKGANAALGDMAEIFGGKAPVTGEIEIVKSRMVLGQVVDNLGLAVQAQPRYFPVIGRAMARQFSASATQPVAAAKFGLSQFAWGGEQLVVTRLEVPQDWGAQPLWLTAGEKSSYSVFSQQGQLLGSGKVGQAAELGTPTGLLRVFVQELSARPGTQFMVVARRRADVIAGLAQNLTVTEKGKQSGILTLSFTGTNPELVRKTLQSIAQTYQRQNVERKSAEAQATLTFLEGQLPEIRKKVESSEAALNAFQNKSGSVDLTKETEIVLQESVGLEARRLELEAKRREALQRFTPNHPVVQTLDAQLGQLGGRIGRVAGQAKNLPETQQELLKLTRDLKVNTELYTSLLNNSQQLQVVRAGTVGNVRIIDSPDTPILPIKPKSSLITALGLMLGLMLGVAVIFINRALHAGVQDPAIIEAALGIPTYANVPFAVGQKQLERTAKQTKSAPGLLANSHPHDVAVEALRSLRTALHFAQVDAPNNIVMLTGPSPGLGKSFVSLNLAATLAAAGKRVVVIDADMRRGHMHESIGAARNPGLSDVITGAATVQSALHTVNADGLQVMATGTIPPNPAELLLRSQFADLLGTLSRQFDVVLVDTPPVLAVTDAAIIGRLAGTTLIVLKAGEHPLRMVQDTYRRLQAAGVAVRGTIFNQTSQGGAAYDKYGYKYGYYQYQYSSQ